MKSIIDYVKSIARIPTFISCAYGLHDWETVGIPSLTDKTIQARCKKCGEIKDFDAPGFTPKQMKYLDNQHKKWVKDVMKDVRDGSFKEESGTGSMPTDDMLTANGTVKKEWKDLYG